MGPIWQVGFDRIQTAFLYLNNILKFRRSFQLTTEQYYNLQNTMENDGWATVSDMVRVGGGRVLW